MSRFGFPIEFPRRRCLAILRNSLLLAAVALTCGPLHSALAETYTVTEIGHPGGTLSQANGINNAGQVVGFIQLSGGGSENTVGFVYSGGSITTVAPLPGDDYSDVSGINNSGEIVGDSTSATSNNVSAFSQTPTQTTNLGTLGGTYAVANGVNSSGEIVGGSTPTGSFQTEAFTYIGGAMTSLGTNGGLSSNANGVNDSGDVVGYYEDSDYANNHAFLYDPTTGNMNSLGALGGNDESYSSDANAINNAGDVVGSAQTASRDTDAFEYTGGTLIDLGNFGGADGGASSINNLGQIVGYSDDADSNYYGFIFENGHMINLDSLLAPGSNWEITNAVGINDSGQIAADGVNTVTGQVDALLLTPNFATVPTPTAALGGAGLLGLLFLRARRSAASRGI